MSTTVNRPSVDEQAFNYIFETYQESLQIKEDFLNRHGRDLVTAAGLLGEAIENGNKILICGNGGSAADAQHWAAEMVGRMLIERRPLPALALTTDSSILTAVANDYAYDEIFSKQVEGLGKAGDVLVAISTSGNSKNVLNAVDAAKKKGMKVIALTGRDGGSLAQASDLVLCARLGKNSSRIQETHSFAIHSLVDVLDRYFLK